MNVRAAIQKDKAQVFQLFDEFGALINTEHIPSKVGSAMFDEIIERSDTHIFVVEEKGKLFGVATLYLLPNIRHGWKRGHIEDFFVTDTARRKGIGSFLLSAIKDYCRDHNIKVIKLDSGNELTWAHSFYEKNGGKTTERFFRFDIE